VSPLWSTETGSIQGIVTRIHSQHASVAHGGGLAVLAYALMGLESKPRARV